jgi:hypothetical protein
MQQTTNYSLQKPEAAIDNVDISVINQNMDIIDLELADRIDKNDERITQWANKAEKSGTVNSTLLATGWAGTAAPYTQTLTVQGVTAPPNENNVMFDMGMSITKAQNDAGLDAVLRATAQGTNSVTISAFGVKPSIDIPVQFVILG